MFINFSSYLILVLLSLFFEQSCQSRDRSPKSKSRETTKLDDLKPEQRITKNSWDYESSTKNVDSIIATSFQGEGAIKIKFLNINKNTEKLFFKYELCPLDKPYKETRVKNREDSVQQINKAKECLKGQTFPSEGSIILPLFYSNLSLVTSLCDKKNCNEPQTNFFKNPNAIYPKDKKKIEKDNNLKKFHDVNLEFRKSILNFYEYLNVQGKDNKGCFDALSKEEKDLIHKLKEMNLEEMINFILMTDPSKLWPLLDEKDREKLRDENKDLFDNFLITGERKSSGIIYQVLLGIFAGWGLYGGYWSISSISSWYDRLDQRRTIDIGKRKGQRLVEHKETGFLVEKEFRKLSIDDIKTKGGKFYVEDTVKFGPISDGKSGWVYIEDPRKFGGDGFGLKYYGNRYYAYDYNKNSYILTDTSSEPRVVVEPSKKQKRSAYWNSFTGYGDVRYKDFVLDRTLYSTNKGGGFNDIIVENQKVSFLDNSAVIEKYGGKNKKFGDVNLKNVNDYRKKISNMDVQYFWSKHQAMGVIHKPVEYIRTFWSVAKIGLAVAAIGKLASDLSQSLAESDSVCFEVKSKLLVLFKKIVNVRVRMILILYKATNPVG